MKTCSYSCVYCQLGKTRSRTIMRVEYCKPSEVLNVVLNALSRAKKVDYVTFVGDGEPTLCYGIGQAARLIAKECSDVKLALISNSSIIWRRDVVEDALNFDFVSMKLDAATPTLFKLVNRPHEALRLEAIVSGLTHLSRESSSILAIETVLVKDLNDGLWHADALAEVLRVIEPDVVYLNAPIRPPAEEWVEVPPLERIEEFAKRVEKYLGRGKVVPLPLHELSELLEATDPLTQIVEVAKLHPLPLDLALGALKRVLGEDRAKHALAKLVSEGRVRVVKYRGREYIRAF